MAHPLLTLDELAALLQTAGIHRSKIDAVRKHAADLFLARNIREAAIDRPPDAPLEPGTDTVTVSSGFGQKSRKGFVVFTLNDQACQMDAAKAREIGIMLLESAEAAISDELFVTLMTQQGISIETAGRLLVDLREIRQGTRGISWPS